MVYIDSTLVEFRRAEVESIPAELLVRQKAKLRSFYYELYDSYLRGGTYVARYMFYTLKAVKRLTPTQIRRQFLSLAAPQRVTAAAPDESRSPAEDAAGREVILYTHGTPDEGRIADYLRRNVLPDPAMRFAEHTDSLDELKKAAFCAFRKNALLLLSHDSRLLDLPLFYAILDEYQTPVRSVDFPWLCRNNLRLMRALALYRAANS